MSADDYWLVRKHRKRYAVTHEFMSADVTPTADESTRWFDTLEDAISYASSEWTEYGIYFDFLDTEAE